MATTHFVYFFLFWIYTIVSSSSATTPSPLTGSPGNLTCDFESDSLCGWTKINQNLEWVVRNGTRFGMRDHTLDKESGHFLTTIGTNHIHGTAMLSGPEFRQGPHCLEFYLTTPSAFSSQVVVYKIVSNLLVPLYESRGKVFRDWEKRRLSLISPQPYKIVISSRQSTGQIGQVFIDDIKVMDGRCPLKPLSDINVTCDFEDDDRMCGFQLDTPKDNSDQDWLLYNDSIPLLGNMKKISDHSLGTPSGHCLVSHLYKDKTVGEVETIRSPIYKGTGTHCLSFYYLMFANNPNTHHQAKDVGELQLYLIPDGGKPDTQTLNGTWTRGKGREWILIHVQFVMTVEYRVVFKSLSSHNQTVYGIDDVTIRDFECPKPETTTRPTTTTTQPTTTAKPTTTTQPTSTTRPTTTTQPTTTAKPTTTANPTTTAKPTTTTQPTTTAKPTTTTAKPTTTVKPTTTAKPTTTQPTTTSPPASTTTPAQGGTSTDSQVFQIGSKGRQTEEKSSNTWVIALGVGVGLVLLIAVVVIFVARNRRRKSSDRDANYKNSETTKIHNTRTPNEFKSLAFSNPLSDDSTDPMNKPFPVFQDQGEALA